MKSHARFVLFVLLTLLSYFSVRSSHVLDPAASDSTFDAVLYRSSPSRSFEEIGVVWYMPLSVGEACSSSTLNASANGTQALAVLTVDINCLPETVAKAAHEKGFSAVIWRTGYNTVGYEALSTWISNTAPIPMYEVSSFTATALEPEVTKSIQISPISNPYESLSWIGPQIPLFFTLIALSIAKIVICSRSLPAHIVAIRATREISSGQLVLILEIMASTNALLECIDFVGQLHVLPLVLWLNFMVWACGFNFVSTFILAKAILSAEAAVRGVKFEKKRSFILNGSFAMFIFLNALFGAIVGYNVYAANMFLVVMVAMMVLFQLIVGLHFFFNKRRVLKMLLASVANKENGSLEELRNLERMSFFLYVSAFFMFGYIFAQVLPAYGAISGSVSMIVYGQYAAAIFNALSGFSHVLSLPEKITGIRYSFVNVVRSRQRSVEVTSSQNNKGHEKKRSETQLPLPTPEVEDTTQPHLMRGPSSQASSTV